MNTQDKGHRRANSILSVLMLLGTTVAKPEDDLPTKEVKKIRNKKEPVKVDKHIKQLKINSKTDRKRKIYH